MPKTLTTLWSQNICVDPWSKNGFVANSFPSRCTVTGTTHKYTPEPTDLLTTVHEAVLVGLGFDLQLPVSWEEDGLPLSSLFE